MTFYFIKKTETCRREHPQAYPIFFITVATCFCDYLFCLFYYHEWIVLTTMQGQLLHLPIGLYQAWSNQLHYSNDFFISLLQLIFIPLQLSHFLSLSLPSSSFFTIFLLFITEFLLWIYLLLLSLPISIWAHFNEAFDMSHYTQNWSPMNWIFARFNGQLIIHYISDLSNIWQFSYLLSP